MILLFLFSFSLACSMVGFTKDCSDHGVCAFDQRIGGTRCVCDNGYTGITCMESVSTTNASAPVTAAPVTAAPVTAVPVTVAPVTAAPVTAAPTGAPTVVLTAVMFPTGAPPTTAPAAPTVAPITTAPRSNNSICIDRLSKVDPSTAGKVCSGHGACKTYDDPEMSPNMYCDCEPRFLGTYCQHAQKSKGIAAILEFFVGAYGASQFYLGYTALGVVKLLLGIFGCCGACIGGCIFFICAGNGNEREGGVVFSCCVGIVCLMFTAASIWVTVSFIMILVGAVPDSDGFALYDGVKK